MILQKIRAFFEWLGKRSTAKSRKALDYEWTTMSPEGETPVKTVDLGEPEEVKRPVPVKAVDLEASRPADPVSSVQREEKPVKDTLEQRMTAVLKTMSLREALESLKGTYEKAAVVRRSRVALLAFLEETPQAVDLLEEKVRQKAAEKPQKSLSVSRRRTTTTKAPANKTDAAKSSTRKPSAKKPVAKKSAPAKSDASEAVTSVSARKAETEAAVAAVSRDEEAKQASARETAEKSAPRRSRTKTAKDRPAAKTPVRRRSAAPQEPTDAQKVTTPESAEQPAGVTEEK